MKRRIASLSAIIIYLTVSFQSVFAFQTNEGINIDKGNINKGIVGVKYGNGDNIKSKLIIEKDDAKYIYDIKADERVNSFPLQLVNGEYKVSLFKNIEGNRYKKVLMDSIIIKLEDNKEVFLNSIQIIEWNDSSEAVKKAKELTEGTKNNEEKVQAIYKFIINNFNYDYEKLNKLKYDYLPNIDKTLEEGKGICYDFSSLFAAMLRSLGIPAKLVKGYTQNAKGYHVWNEVYIEDLNEFIIIDTTYDLQMKKKAREVSMIKDNKLYDKIYEY
ncbi:transglutaminase domain-containing protein [Clostridium bovifaecis]|uniref:Transglutaminase domain-containing protein n=1 Tax=Clostridium bovifaecis TaxID=2184719 RepID=A0A6I6F009_9CLOT|nr:transglutaminase domain-containing protein [Clostridium bovifaecis]